ncbi:MAG: hypothetical protein LBI11_05995 [Streptococcaceae bacterium]|jgi:YbbR domain-containing protein|nr:hypothetical protein [Streptococcaceae bacterium]
MFAKIFNSRAFYIIVSILLACVLYLNATSNQALNSGSTNSGGQVYSSTLKNMPITLKYDTSKYFVSGYVSSATVTLTSYNQIKLTQQESSDSRTFSLVSDLTKLGIGTFTTPIKVTGLTSDVQSSVVPSSMSITIEKSVTKTFTITPIVAPELIPSGITIDSLSVDTASVKVTAGTNSIKNIAKIEAVLPSSSDLHSNFSGTVSLIAVDSSGNVVPAQIGKATVNLTVKVKTTSSSSSSSSK